MNSTSSITSIKDNVKYIIRESIYFLAFFLYIWLRINPALYVQRQEPVFLFDYNFFRGFLKYPGGIVDYVAAFFSQLCYYPILGALIVTIIIWTISRLTYALIRIIKPDHEIQFIHYVPAVLLLVLHSQYEFPLAISLGIFLFLLFLLSQNSINGNVLLRIISNLILGFILYYMAAGTILFFGLMCALLEAFYHRRIVLSVIYLLIAVIIPYIAKEVFFLINFQMAFLYLLPIQESYKPVFVSYLLVLFYPSLFLIYQPYVFKWFEFLKKLRFRKSWLRYSFQTIILFVVTGLAAFFSFNKNNHLLFQVDYYARHERWQEIIEISKKEPSNLLQVAFQTNRALFHTGQLLENMFSFPQIYGRSGLIMPEAFIKSAPLQESDFCYDLGSINESKHWAYEALGTDGETPWILKRLAIVNFVNGDFRAAERYLNVLDKTLFFKSWSQQFRKILQNPELALDDKTLSHGRIMQVKKDFIVASSHPPRELDSILAENPKNKMVFEYRIAHELLTCLLAGLPMHLKMLNNFDYQHIPRHIEEAIISLWAFSRQRQLPPVFRYVRRETIQHFQDFNQVIEKYGGDRIAAKPELQQRFGNTYWFYLIYNNPSVRMSEKATPKVGEIK